MEAPALPLAGLEVLDLSRLVPGPYATLVLSDLGARVDKVEEPGTGDYLRGFPPLCGHASAEFHALNRDKRSIAIDLKNPRGAGVLLRLLPSYDVLVEGFRPGVLDRLGIGPKRMLQSNPRLVLCSITGYGRTGPLSRRAGHDLTYLARGGMLGMTGPPDRPPTPFGGQVADIGAALWAVVGILAALEERHRTGRGRHVDLSMIEAGASFGVMGLARALSGTPNDRGADLLTGGIAPYGTYETKDGGHVALAALEPKFWVRFCEDVGLEPDLSALVPGPHQVELKRRLQDLFRMRTRDDWEQFFLTRDACCEPVLSPEEAVRDAEDDHAGRTFLVDDAPAPVRMLRTPLGRTIGHRRSPRLGEHTDDVLHDAGFTSDDIAALRADGAIA